MWKTIGNNSNTNRMILRIHYKKILFNMMMTIHQVMTHAKLTNKVVNSQMRRVMKHKQASIAKEAP